MSSKNKGSKQQFTDYYMSVHLGACIGPVDEFTGLYVGEKAVWEGSITAQGDLWINEPELFGGQEKEGGLSGVVHFMPGNATQTMPEYLAAKFGLTTATCPGFRGLTNLFFSGGAAIGWIPGFLWGTNSPYLKTIWGRFRRAPRGLAPNKASIGRNANPVHMIYECLTNTDWGMGAPSTIINVATFNTAADVMIAENFGLAMIWTQQATIESFISEILDHIQATLYVNPRTGLLEIKLLREVSIVGLREFGPDNCDVTNFQRKSWAETTNEIVVTWTNPVNEQEETISYQDLAAIAMQGGVVSDSRNYYGIRDVGLAARVAQRDLRTAAAPLATCQIEALREAWDLTPGDCVALTWPEYGIAKIVFRVGPVDYGKPGSGYVKASLMEDIFSLAKSEYDDPPSSAWVDPSEAPHAMPFVEILTPPPIIVAALGDENLEYPETNAMVLAAQTGSDTSGFVLYEEQTLTTGTTDFVKLGFMGLTARGTLPIDLPQNAAFNVPSFGALTYGPGPQVGGFVLIGTGGDAKMEWAMLDGYLEATGWTLARGVLDTVPRAWPAGTPVWFLGPMNDPLDSTVYAAGETVRYKLLSRTSRGTLASADAPVNQAVVGDRPHCPSRPANVTVAGTAFGSVTVPAAGSVAVTWANRNRLTEDSQVRRWMEANVVPEAGQTTVIQIKDYAGNIITEHADLTGTSFNIPIASFGDLSRGLVRVGSRRDGLDSLQAIEIEVVIQGRSGYGFDYGANYGG